MIYINIFRSASKNRLFRIFIEYSFVKMHKSLFLFSFFTPNN